MTDVLQALIKTAAEEWAKRYFHTPNVFGHVYVDEDDMPGRHVVSLAVYGLDLWQAAEVWVENGEVISVSDIGEGLPPDGIEWPW